MAHRKHLSQEGHAEPEKKAKNISQKPTASKANNKSQKIQEKSKEPSTPIYNNPNIKDEHGEY